MMMPYQLFAQPTRLCKRERPPPLRTQVKPMIESTASGGCQCGQVRYTMTPAHSIVYACHCRECQKQSSGAFGLSMPVRMSAIRFDGDMAVYGRPTDSGAVTTCFFCPRCGSRIYHRDSTAGEFISLKAGTLDDTSVLCLVAHLWVRRKQPWIRIDPELPSFDTQPDDLGQWRSNLVSRVSASAS